MKDKSRRPHSHPKKHTEEEIKLIKNYKANNKETGLVVLWIKLRNAGYTRGVTSLYRMMIRLGIYNKTPSKKKEKNVGYYPEMTYPGEKIQIDVKSVPKKCLSKELQEMGERYYQYTAIDEYSRYRYLWSTNAHDTYSSTEFLERAVKAFPFKVEKVQIKDLTKIVPTLKIANATIHFDETSSHMHIVGVPVVENCTRGMKKQVVKSKLFTKTSLTEIQDKMRNSCIKSYNKFYEVDSRIKQKG